MALTFLRTTSVSPTRRGRVSLAEQGAVFHDDALKVGLVTVATIRACHLQLGIRELGAAGSARAAVSLLQQLCLFLSPPFSLPLRPVSVSPPHSAFAIRRRRPQSLDSNLSRRRFVARPVVCRLTLQQRVLS